MDTDPAVTEAYAGFAASALARLVRKLCEEGVIAEGFRGELAAVAASSASPDSSPEVKQAMEVIQAQLGLPSPEEERRQRERDELDEADPDDEA